MLRRLTQRAHSRQELDRVLATRNTDPEVAAAVLDRLTEVGLVDDRAFAEAWVDSRREHRHLSRRALRQELVQKGVGREVVDDVLGGVEPDSDYAAAVAVAERRARSMTGLPCDVRRRRIAGALARRGFPADVVRRVLSDVCPDRMDGGWPDDQA